MFWLLGSLGGVRWPDVGLAAPVAIGGFVIGILHARALDGFAFGVDAAAAIGIPVTRVRLILFGLTAAMTATMVSIVGSIGFVGLVVPHAARFLVGPGHMRLLPACFMIGAVFMVVLSFVLAAFAVSVLGLIVAYALCALVVWGWVTLCRRLIGGQTGDLIGALQALIEIAALTGFMIFV